MLSVSYDSCRRPEEPRRYRQEEEEEEEEEERCTAIRLLKDDAFLRTRSSRATAGKAPALTGQCLNV